MRLRLEEWLEGQALSPEASSCFNESFICYRAEACKAALLFGYLAFMHVIRDRMLTSPCPAGITPERWTSIQNGIRGAEAWDSRAFDATQQLQPAPIFIVSDDLRRQVGFWKARRNDCAHSKDNIITLAYVEALYVFIESNLNRFIVNGSKTEMIRKIMEYFDPSVTPPGVSIEPIIISIPGAVMHSELSEFIAEIIARLDAERGPFEAMFHRENPKRIPFFYGCFRYGSPALINVCTEYLLSNQELLITFLRAHPDKVTILTGHPERIRRLWYEDLFTANKDDFPLLASLVRSGLLPTEQTEEAFRQVISKGTAYVPNAPDNLSLEGAGYYRQLEYLLVNNNLLSAFSWANKTKDLIIKYLNEHPVSLDIARSIYRGFNSVYFSRDLARDLDEFFRANPIKKTEFLAFVSRDNEIDRPSAIPSLTDES